MTGYKYKNLPININILSLASLIDSLIIEIEQNLCAAINHWRKYLAPNRFAKSYVAQKI